MFQEVAENPAPNQASPEAGIKPADYQSRRTGPGGVIAGANAQLVENGLLPGLALSGAETIEAPGIFRNSRGETRVVGTKAKLLLGGVITAGQNSDVAASYSKISAFDNAVVQAWHSEVAAHALSTVFAGFSGSVHPARLGFFPRRDAEHGISLNGFDSSKVFADERATVVAFAGSRVEATDHAVVTAERGSSVKAFGSARVEANFAEVQVVDFATTRAERSDVVAGGNSIVSADDNSKVAAWDRAMVLAWNGTIVHAQNSSQVVANNDSVVVANDAASVTALPGSLIRARGHSTVHAHVGSVVLATENSQTIADAGSFVVARSNANVRAKAGSNVLAEDGAKVQADAGANVTAQRHALVEAKSGANVDREGFFAYWDPNRPSHKDADVWWTYANGTFSYNQYWSTVQRDWLRKACQTTTSDSRVVLQRLSAAESMRSEKGNENFDKDWSFARALRQLDCRK